LESISRIFQNLHANDNQTSTVTNTKNVQL
jgi:hypothetical protein